jgi:predicted secreted Zn-dependent protease
MMVKVSGQCALAAFSLFFALGTVAEARPLQSTQYTYYGISGATPATIYSSLIKRGPRVGGVKAYASTTAVSSQAGQMLQGKTCQIKNYKFKIDFTINLPKLQNEANLDGGTRAGWRNFSNFLRTHEETHRSIWLGCAAALEANVKSLRVGSCKEADARTTALWNQMKATCGKKQVAFDAQQQRALMRHPFVQMVLRRNGTSQHALAVPDASAQ